MTKQNKLPDFFINAFYESKFRVNLFIVKASGRIIQDNTALLSLMNDIKTLSLAGIRIILIYGFGNAMDVAAEQRGVKVTKHNTHRVTDAPTLELLKQVVCGSMSTRISSMMAKTQIDGLNLNAVPHNWLSLSLWDKEEKGADFGYVGEINDVHSRPIIRMLKNYNVVAVPCVATMADGQHCNMNADRLAMHLANALHTDKLIFLSNVDGVLDKDKKTIPLITDDNLQNLINVMKWFSRNSLKDSIKVTHLL